MSGEFEVEDMVYFIEEGCDFSKAILHGVVWQKNYVTVTRGSLPAVSSYEVLALNHLGSFENFHLSPECVFKTADELLENLKDSLDHKFNLESFLEESAKYRAGKVNDDVIINGGILEAMHEGYESAVIDAELEKA